MVYDDGTVLPWSTYSVVGTLDRYQKETGRKISGRELFDLAGTDPVAKKYVDRFYYYLALGCLSIGFALDPDLIVIGGAISCREDFKQQIDYQLEKIKKTSKTYTFNHTEIKAAQLGNTANLLGALFNHVYIHRCELKRE